MDDLRVPHLWKPLYLVMEHSHGESPLLSGKSPVTGLRLIAENPLVDHLPSKHVSLKIPRIVS